MDLKDIDVIRGNGLSRLTIEVIRVLCQRPLAPSVTSAPLLANDKGKNEMVQEALHRSPATYLINQENPEKLS
jgi:hypothetical protein